MTTMIADTTAVAFPSMPEIKKRFAISDLLNAPNVADWLTDEERAAFGRWVVGGYVKDISTRTEWTQRNAEAIKLALQYKEDKTFPWTGCANVKFPLVTIGALQFLARISILTKGRRIVNFEYVGKDPAGKKREIAARISQHMSMQLVDEDTAWFENDEQAKFSACLLGSAFKKSFFDPVRGTNISEFVPPQNFVFDYYCKDLATTQRVTHAYYMDGNKIRERTARKLFIEETEPQKPGPEAVTNLLKQTADEISGLWQQSEGESFRVLEQHCWFDFDGDGYAEPYIMSVREDTGHLYRIVARYFKESIHKVNDLAMRQADAMALKADDAKTKSEYEKKAQALETADENVIVRIDPVQYFTKYLFIPSPDGGALGLGFGALLGPINEAVNSLMNQLLDAGTMSNTAGGFMGRGVKLKGGTQSFAPFEWKVVDATGDDLRKNIMPLPTKEPSSVLFQLLGILITYGEKISSATDIMTGVSPGQNTPAETSRNTVEQGMMLFSGIYTRMYRSFREELQKLYELNRLYLRTSPRFWELTEGEDAIIAPDDYTGSRMRVFPAADASTVSGQQRKDKADKLAQFALSPLGGKLDKDYVTRNWLEANEYDVDAAFPDPNGDRAVKPPMDPKMAMKQMELEQNQKQHQDNMQLQVATLQATIAKNNGQIAKWQAEAELALARADGIDKEQAIAVLNAQIGAVRAENEHLAKAAEFLLKSHQLKDTMDQNEHNRIMDVHDRLTAQKEASKPAEAK